MVIGLVKDIGSSAAAAWKEVGRLGLDNHLERQLGNKPTFRELAEHFRKHELKKESGVGVKAPETVGTHELLLDRWILPRWGEKITSEIKPLEIESWFETLTSTPQLENKKPLAWSSIGKIKSVMAQVFKHAQRHELIPAVIDKDGRPTNPVLLARSEAGSDYEAKVVTPEQMMVILHELDKPETRLEWTLALLHAATALRPEEAFGLKWGDIDWEKETDQHPQRLVEGQGDCRQERGQHDASRDASGAQPGTQGLAPGVSLPSRLGLGLRVEQDEREDAPIRGRGRAGLSSAGCGQGGSDSRPVPRPFWVAQSASLPGHVLCRQRHQPSDHPEHDEACETDNNGNLHASCQCGADGSSGKVPGGHPRCSDGQLGASWARSWVGKGLERF